MEEQKNQSEEVLPLASEHASKTSKLVWVLVGISWLIYLPTAFLVFAFSGMSASLGVTPQAAAFILSANALPLFTVIGVTFLALKKQNWKIAASILPAGFIALVIGVWVPLYLEDLTEREERQTIRQLQESCPSETYFNAEKWRQTGAIVCVPVGQ